ncbi:MAG: cysteine desulfurase [Cenarchaeum sp. SB0665_bin_23]|nr:cysteine desulfurase [Cenarchaeum sp. SB0667_bin_13]MXY37915.1 cysteine desulfurase [Cenarchaeum sp. SB0664_bin_35]MXY60849.1 cysteine desulfurase [Cenarchaeum sp. SB0665_bin_23]MXZ93537.1 cysteine desulfurase [Cenarchaeum sp. SB0666_bin_15]MYB46605.1 cysteine desulfurase [Cenarchaeum sp. SB0662_bin_33]MYC79881.1 cysteine desulfurase [Cenarchaeum sp. SB0661_bin_35]MYD58762.1 cysteine desulfurase [Cenarchaeum sp. SB0678_bin_8]MYG33342.1 cysteine desulfurase [Cenarchaeum sp. SB0677_bin_16]
MQVSLLNIRKDFPILSRTVRGGKPLIYLDNAATTQKPNHVVDTISDYYRNYNANTHRAIYALAEEATEKYESVRDRVAKFLNIQERSHIIFVRGTTEGINLVAYAWGRPNITKGDVIVTTEYEHHSNIVPWQLLCKEKGATLKYIPIDEQGRLMLDILDGYIAEENVKMVTFSLMSNVLGTITNAHAIMSKCRKVQIPTLIDAAQAVPHMRVDVSSLGCDFFTFSGHKMMGPTGIGVLYATQRMLDKMSPFHGGGDMIREVHKQESTWNDLPHKFEAGTPNIADVIGLGAAVDYLERIGMDNIRAHEMELTSYALNRMRQIPGITIYGPTDIKERGGVISFNFADVHPHDVAHIVDEEGIAIRSGHHCAQVLMEELDVAATSRASFYVYNTKEEVDALIDALQKVARVFKLE